MGLGLFVLLPLACQMGNSDPAPLEGKAAPEILLPTLDGQNVKLSDEKGKVVVLDFWATWCPPCRASLPHTQQLSTNADWAAKGLVVWAVDDAEAMKTVEQFVSDNRYTFTVLLDGQQAADKAYGVQAIPQVIVIGRDGIVKNVFVGYSPDTGGEIDKAVEAALAEPAK
jgi:peroxiredoxin